MPQFIHPLFLFLLIVLGAVGVGLALPRGGRWPQLVGALLAGTVGGVALIALAISAGEHRPNIYFYIFSLLGLGSALRVVTHPRPVYAALYFILTVIATAGLFVLLSAEFMAFALIIVYAGAILITYLFVIMLATQAPDEGETEVLADYDTNAREPIAATVVCFLLLALLTSFLFRGIPGLPGPRRDPTAGLLAEMPRKIERILKNNNMLRDGEHVLTEEGVVAFGADGSVLRLVSDAGTREIPKSEWPEDLRVTNVEAVGFNLLRDHPGAIEIAGVILLMAMLGAVVLSRKQVEMDEEAKRAMAAKLRRTLGGGES